MTRYEGTEGKRRKKEGERKCGMMTEEKGKGKGDNAYAQYRQEHGTLEGAPTDLIQETTWKTVYDILKAGEEGDPEGMHNMEVLIYSAFEPVLHNFDSFLQEGEAGSLGRLMGPYGRNYAWFTWGLQAELVDTVLATSEFTFRPPLNREEIMRQYLVDYVWGRINYAD